jgi:hypothetical protein
MARVKLVVYSSKDEVIVCAKSAEKKMLKAYFRDVEEGEYKGRDREDYECRETRPGDPIVRVFTGPLVTRRGG